MSSYKSIYTGQQVDNAVGKVLNDDSKTKYGNLIGNIEDQQDLIGMLDAMRTTCLDLVVEDEELVLKSGDETLSFDDVVHLVFEEPKLVYVRTPDSFLFPGIFDIDGNSPFIYFVGFLTTSTPGMKYLKMEYDSSITLQQVYTEHTSNKVTEISIQSTDEEYPSAKAVYNAIDNVLGDINEALDEIIGEVPEEEVVG